MSATVSVIIPTFDRAYVLREAVDSVLAQLHGEVELIVVDDGSTDGTRELMASAYRNEDRVHYRYQPNAGLASARNTGLDLATGDYLAFLDSDDAWKPWHLALLLAALDGVPDVGMIWTDIDAVDANGAVISTPYLAELLSAYGYFSRDDLFSSSFPLADLSVDLPPEFLSHRLYVGDIFSPMLMGNLVLPSSVVMRRERLEQVGRFDERLSGGADHEFFLRVCRVGPVAYADITDVRYRIGTGDKMGGLASAGSATALEYLHLLDGTLERDADRITLSPEMITTARVHAHRWVGEMQLLAGSRRSARAHFARVIRIRPRQPWILVLIVLTFLPRTVFLNMVRGRRLLKPWLRRIA